MGVEQLRTARELTKKPLRFFERVRAERNMRQGLPDVVIAATNLGCKSVASEIEVWDTSMSVPFHYKINPKDILPFSPLNDIEKDFRGYTAIATIPATSFKPESSRIIAFAY